VGGDTGNYVFHDRPGGEHLRLSFDGSLDGHPQRWRAEFVTLASCYADWLQRTGQPPGTPAQLRAFIDVGEPCGAERYLRVALPVARIDRATALKAMIMVRNYRRLRPGRLDYGAVVAFPLQ
jgi:hypothetical protein